MMLVDNVNTGKDRYVVECIAEAAGRLFVRMPPCHNQLNPTDMFVAT